MPTNLDEASTGGSELVFASDLQGTVFKLAEAAVYDADEVRDELGDEDTPAFGRWLPVEVSDGEAWLNAVGELVEELQDAEAESGDGFQVTRCQKSGSEETDPYEVNLEETEPTF